MKRLTGFSVLAAALVLALLGAGCAAVPGGDNTTPRSGTNTLPGIWQLASYLGADGRTFDAVAGSTPLVTFRRDGMVTGTVGCNHFSATYTATGNQLTIAPPVSTMMYCTSPAGVMDQEQQVFELFARTAGYQVTGSTLHLLDQAGTRLMTFHRAAEPVDAPLVGTPWRLAGFSDNATARSALAGSNATVVFGNDGRLRGSTGCNELSGPYTTSGNAISIGPLAVTERACADPALMAQERDLLEALEIAATYEITGDQLTLTDAPGGQQVRFVRAA